MAIIIFLFGIIFGSFFNAVIYRIPNDIPISKGRSICPNCKTTLKPIDLVPVFSWLFLKGKCRYCKAPISFRYPLIELFTGFLYLFTYLYFGFGWQLLIYIPFFSMLLITTIIDYEHMIISTYVLLISSAISFAGLVLAKQDIVYHLLAMVVGAAIYTAIYFIGKLIYKREAFGIGDIFLIAAIGLVVGVRNVIITSFFASVVAVLILIVTIPFRKKIKKDQEIPFGPSICIAAFIMSLFGDQIFGWYMSLF